MQAMATHLWITHAAQAEAALLSLSPPVQPSRREGPDDPDYLPWTARYLDNRGNAVPNYVFNADHQEYAVTEV